MPSNEQGSGYYEGLLIPCHHWSQDYCTLTLKVLCYAAVPWTAFLLLCFQYFEALSAAEVKVHRRALVCRAIFLFEDGVHTCSVATKAGGMLRDFL